MGAYRLFGGPDALQSALHETRAGAVVLVGAESDGGAAARSTLAEFLESHGAVDVYHLRVAVETPVDGARRA